ncbi:MAG: hypothetical protein DCF19_03725 [Pseudanabaena frigida]|uniref:Uncharacterized protein n=1 Tax=Pseudanabaena frigida TaxID=945775 RepID=A0A2W4WPH1_9CYAN|nr:MAG: hypothetical protein DCF19_03725 [Pseudanabaena frigida]
MQDIQVPAMGRQTFLLIRILGYSSLSLFLLDLLTIVIPLKFTDAVWELNTYGQIVERVPLLLLSFPLILFGEYSARMKWEQITTKIISWMTLVMAILFFLGVPLAIVNTFRVQNIRQAEVITKTAQQNGPVQEIAERLNKASTDSEIRNVLRSLNPQQQALVAKIPKPQEVKKKLLTEISSSINQIQTQSEDLKRRISSALWKESIKWAIAATISGLFLVYVWIQSKWARVGINY